MAFPTKLLSLCPLQKKKERWQSGAVGQRLMGFIQARKINHAMKSLPVQELSLLYSKIARMFCAITLVYFN